MFPGVTNIWKDGGAGKDIIWSILPCKGGAAVSEIRPEFLYPTSSYLIINAPAHRTNGQSEAAENKKILLATDPTPQFKTIIYNFQEYNGFVSISKPRSTDAHGYP